MNRQQVTVWTHDDNFSKDEVLVAPDIFGEDCLQSGTLLEIAILKPLTEPRHARKNDETVSNSSDSANFPASSDGRKVGGEQAESRTAASKHTMQKGTQVVDPHTRYCFIAKPMPPDIRASHPTLQVSITSSIANTFRYRQRPQAVISLANRRACSASHVELIFRDEYLSRADMWRLVRSELAGKTVYKGQKVLFLGTIKATVKSIYIRGRTVSSAYFCEGTLPVFRSESARYVLFIQMSREMWDFDSEGSGEIMFSRVIDGFLPELFKKWAELEARHLVTIVLFGRLEYDHHALAALQRLNSDAPDGTLMEIDQGATYRDFYRVVVTDMASGQWTTILNELKKDFRVFLRDITLHQPRADNLAGGSEVLEANKISRTRICGKPTNALRGNILEAINIASSQYTSDYIDRDLVRTGISIIVITPGTGVFEVDRQLLDLTSENLTNNGIGIDLVCLSRMPLHSVPLFRWQKSPPKCNTRMSASYLPFENPSGLRQFDSNGFATPLPHLPSYDSFSRSTAGQNTTSKAAEIQWSFGIPQWIDVSYWTSSYQRRPGIRSRRSRETVEYHLGPTYSKTFVPRVRMYELQMMGVMELGLANISIPYLSEGRHSKLGNRDRGSGRLGYRKSKAALYGRSASSHRAVPNAGKSGFAHLANRGRGLLSTQAEQQGDFYDRMDAYDDSLFAFNSVERGTKPEITSKQKSDLAAKRKQRPNSRSPNEYGVVVRQADQSDADTVKTAKGVKATKSQTLELRAEGVKANLNPNDFRISRAISFALRGLGPSAPRAVASTEINIENVQAKHSVSNMTPRRALGDSSRKVRSSVGGTSNRLSLLSQDSEGSEPSDSARHTQAKGVSPSRPISIKNTVKEYQEINPKSRAEVGKSIGAQSTQTEAYLQGLPLQPGNSTALVDSGVRHRELKGDIASSTSSSDISPWVKNVNPANPTKTLSKTIPYVGRWQHLFPHPPKTSSVKWKSLCTPASVPMTTEFFPSADEWEHQYSHTNYVVTQSGKGESTEVPRSREWLLREMIGLRLSHGYQLVTGKGVKKVIKFEDVPSANYFMPDKKIAQDGVQIFMSMGNTVQRLLCMNSSDIQVTRFVRKPSESSQGRIESITYNPVVKTFLSKAYAPRTMTLAGFSKEYPWNLADSHLADQKHDLSKVYEQLRFWRARFVVIPVEPPPNARRPTQSMSEDNEEEIHLLGIRELTKMWQKNRYIPQEERRFRPITGKRKDPNPLEISFQTLNPSEVVATEIEKLLATDEGAEPKQIQLLPDSELLERSTTSLSKIAQLLQSEKGVEIANRMWHWRLHKSCFKGDDFTNWLISSFKDIDSREEAVDFGNELMQHGLFHHVSTRHTFKDGNYFYTIAPEHRVSRPESRNSWFPGGRRPDRAVAATPIAEGETHESLHGSQSQLGLSSGRQVETRSSEKGSSEKRQLAVSLTKRMRIDVDHRTPKRSERPEIVNLHYDRLHNPENCYHVELSWFNVTSKLIEDAIVGWATQSEKYGLRLVEVPIREACCSTDREPFRAPYRINLKVAPPPLGNDFGGNGPALDKLIYHKALLKKFYFVLDLEAASAFPPDVDVTYTWGKPDYRYTQFVHRSGVILAQITDDGGFLVLANRLYNTRSASAKDTAGKFETRHTSHGRVSAGSGLVGLNAPNSSPHPSPLVRASSDGVGPRDALNASGMATWVTPEQITDELEEFCHNAEKLKAFYKEVSERGMMRKKSGSSSSSVLRPVPESGLESSIPDLRLPASVVTTATLVAKSLGVGLAKRSSPQLNGRDRLESETPATDSSGRMRAEP